MNVQHVKFKNNFLGVFETNPEHDYAKSVPFRVALQIVDRDDPDEKIWMNAGYLKTENAAARVYNMYAIEHYGKDAILNDVGVPTKVQNEDFNVYLNDRPKRAQTYALSVAKAQKLIAEYGDFTLYSGELKGAGNIVQVKGIL